MELKKSYLIFLTIILLISLNGCIMDDELRPQIDESVVWVCEEPYAYFKYDSGRQDFFGEIIVDGARYEVLESESSGPYMEYLRPEAIVGDSIHSEGNIILAGSADYFEGYFEFTVKEDPLNLFDGDLPVMTFTRYTLEEFEEKFGELDTPAESESIA